MTAKPRTSTFFPALLCVSAFVVCIAATRPVLNMGWADDWSYVWSARILADTGHFLYNGYTTPMLGWQLYLGALFIKLFGFSFTSLRLSMLPVSIGAVWLTQRLFVRFGISEWNSAIATLAIALSPIFLLVGFSYMTDVPGYLSIVGCLYLCVRALQAKTDRAAAGWLVAAALSNVLGGTARQIAWLGVLVIVPSTVWLMRRRRSVLVSGTVAWAAGSIMVFATMHWLSRQPYFVRGDMITGIRSKAAYLVMASTLVRAFLYTALVISPVLLGFLVRFPRQSARARKGALATATVFVLAIAYLVARGKPVYWLAPFFFNNYYNDTLGGIIGTPPAQSLVAVRAAMTILVFAAIAAFLLCLWCASTLERRQTSAEAQTSWSTVLVLLGPFTLAYCFLLLMQDSIYDRYLLPLFVIVLVPILLMYQRKIADRLPLLSLPLLILLAAFSTANMHDVFAAGRARVAAAGELRAAGVPRTAIRAGYEYDGWTQLEAAGYLNDARILTPTGVYHPWTRPSYIPQQCAMVFSSHLPAIHPDYELALGPTTCFSDSQFPAVPYTSWIPPHDRAVSIRRVH